MDNALATGATHCCSAMEDELAPIASRWDQDEDEDGFGPVKVGAPLQQGDKLIDY